MTANRVKPGAPPDTEHPVKKLAKGHYYEVLEPSLHKISALRTAASRFAKTLKRAYRVSKGADEAGRPYVRVYRTK